MELTPFTIEEAGEISEDFEDLTDTEFKIGSSPVMLVANVSIAPFNEADKNRFVENYHGSKDSKEALSFYCGDDYDVVLITCDPDNEDDLSYIDIRTFADLRGIKYSFPGA